MTSHRKAREVALQILFQKNFHSEANAQDLFNAFADNFSFADQTKEYALFLVKSILSNEDRINQKISVLSENWRMDRMASVDQILLQIGIFELCFSENTTTAPKLCITDIIDLAKNYSSQDSKSFINGVLDRAYAEQDQG